MAERSAAAGRGIPSLYARDIMSSPVVTIGPGATVAEAARVMLDRRVGALAVVDQSGKYVGLITERRFLPQETGVPFLRGTLLRLLGHTVDEKDDLETAVAEVRDTQVKDVMSTSAPTAREDTSVDQIASQMSREDFHHMPVVRDGRPVGMVSRHDILRIFAGS